MLDTQKKKLLKQLLENAVRQLASHQLPSSEIEVRKLVLDIEVSGKSDDVERELEIKNRELRLCEEELEVNKKEMKKLQQRMAEYEKEINDLKTTYEKIKHMVNLYKNGTIDYKQLINSLLKEVK